MNHDYEVWVTTDHSRPGKVSLRLSKGRLGIFIYHLLNMGGDIHGTFVMKPGHPGSFVQMAIALPKGKREELEALTGVGLDLPPKISLNSSDDGG